MNNPEPLADFIERMEKQSKDMNFYQTFQIRDIRRILTELRRLQEMEEGLKKIAKCWHPKTGDSISSVGNPPNTPNQVGGGEASYPMKGHGSWCAYCGEWGDHQSGWCPKIKELDEERRKK